MGFVGGVIGYRILRTFAPAGGTSSRMDGSAYRDRSKLQVLLGKEALQELKGKTVLDFGCGEGSEAIELARSFARSVIGLDIQEQLLQRGRAAAEREGLSERVSFTTTLPSQVDAVISIDSFEHFASPEEVLALMARTLRPGGKVFVSFGPTWYHPYGGHLFSVFPWAHLVFTERSFIRWRSEFKTDGATKFSEVAGGLNRMTIRRFEKIANESPLHLEELSPVPIRRLRHLSNRLTREFTTAIVRATLSKPYADRGPGHAPTGSPLKT